MPLAVTVNEGVVTKDRIAEGEADQYEALRRSVLASEDKKKQEERERRASQGLPLDDDSTSKKPNLGKRILAFMCLGSTGNK
ncbi:hypothetical protein RBB50_010318 [Rhinocladiella similis]